MSDSFRNLDVPALKMAPYVLLARGGTFNYLEPETSRYDIFDIAHGLSNTCRFGGQCRRFYSVAQHSLLVASIVPPGDRMAALLHDASEAFMCDIPSPLKQLLPDYSALESKVQQSIYRKFGVLSVPQSVHRADIILLATEKRDIMPPDANPWPIIAQVEPLPSMITPWPPALAAAFFVAAFSELLIDETGNLH